MRRYCFHNALYSGAVDVPLLVVLVRFGHPVALRRGSHLSDAVNTADDQPIGADAATAAVEDLITERLEAQDGSGDHSVAGSYDASEITVLEGLEAVRKRPGMYIGSTDSRGLMHCVWEIIDNSVDEALGGYCDRIEVILMPDGSVEVRDNGRGIPVDVEPRTDLGQLAEEHVDQRGPLLGGLVGVLGAESARGDAYLQQALPGDEAREC